LIILFTVFVVLCASAGSPGAQEALPAYGLFVTFDTERNLLSGGCRITLPKGTDIYVGDLRVLSVKLDGAPLQPEIKDGTFKVSGGGTLEIEYEGVFREGPGGVVSKEGISLTRGWYPSLKGLAYYSLKAVLPEGFTGVSEAEEVVVRGNESSFLFSHPREGMTLAAGRYAELKDTFNGVDIHAYFLPEDAPLAETYMRYVKDHLGKYGELLAPYPYRRLSVAESILPGGHSVPTLIILGRLGRDAGRPPSGPDSSLAHAVLKQWFGGLVYCQCESGDWPDGLTTYLADHLYREGQGGDWRQRKKLLTEYQSYAGGKAALKDFQTATDPASQAVVAGRGAMLFHMLKNLIGEDAFNGGLRAIIEERKFEETSWEDMRDAFERASERGLGWFFGQWLLRKDVPEIRIKDPRVAFLGDGPSVHFEVVQSTPPYTLFVPVKVVTDEGESTEMLYMDREEESFEVQTKGKPLELALDEEYDLMRRLNEDEYPPVLWRLLGAERRIVVIPGGEGERYARLAEVLEEEGFTPVEEGALKDEDIMESSLMVLGLEGPVIKRLFGTARDFRYGCKRPPWECPGFTVVVRENPLNPSGVVAAASGDSKEEVDLAAHRIMNYGDYSLTGFKKGKNVLKEVGQAGRGLRAALYKPVKGVEPREALGLDEITGDVIEKPIIYVGESHASFESHRVQLEVIMAMHKKGRKFAIGMEMFQRPFQQALDDYLSGKTDEREFLKASEYFKRWQFDYNLYREILQFAKAKGIQVVALNLRTEITKKVAEGGLDSLTDEERKEIPADMDMADRQYKERLKEIYRAHRTPMDFDYFYQSQILWDETMAHSVDKFLRENPDYQMVVLAGAGHIIYGSGIPQRAYRLNWKEYSTLITSGESAVEGDISDYVLFPEPLPAPEAPKLGVILSEADGQVRITAFTGAGRAESAGLEKDDVIVSIDDWKVQGIDDVRIVLFDKRPGDTLRVRVLRKGFFGTKDLVIPVTL
jgi:aminopeptidase N